MRLLAVGLDESFQFDHPTDKAVDEEEALSLFACHEYDCCIANVLVGKHFPRYMRRKGIKIPIIMLMGWSDAEDRVFLLNQGADRVLEIPIHKELLEAYLQALVRSDGSNMLHNIFMVGDMVFDTTNLTVSVRGVNVKLTKTQYRLLEILAKRPHRIISDKHLLTHMYQLDPPQCNIIKVYVTKIRKKLRPHVGHTGGILTIWGQGLQIDSGTIFERKVA